VNRGRIAHIAVPRPPLPPACRHIADGGGRLFIRSRIQDAHIAPLTSEGLHNGAADAAASASDQRSTRTGRHEAAP
jgi:hypothetical protein